MRRLSVESPRKRAAIRGLGLNFYRPAQKRSRMASSLPYRAGGKKRNVKNSLRRRFHCVCGEWRGCT
eukprot:3077843-Pyramimonas_sp.AAC.1